VYDAVDFGAAAQRNNGGKLARRDWSAVFPHYTQMEFSVVRPRVSSMERPNSLSAAGLAASTCR